MTFMQAYYTSCEIGHRGSKGFQFNAVTPGLDPRLFDQLERLGVYVPPSSSVVQPSPEDLERFPLVLLYQPLGGGRSVVAQSRYIGPDYSGRWGNYFTHYAIADDTERALRDQLPIELWKSPAWTTTESKQLELPRLDEFPLAGVIDAEAIRGFVRERPEHVAEIVEATRLALKTGRRVVIVDEDESIAKWIAAATYALPRHLALATSFTTYTKSPYESNAMIIGTTRDSDFRATQFEIDHQYSVFDFIQGRFSRIDASSRFARGVATSWVQSADRVANFAAFASLVDADVDAASVDQTWFGYALTDGRIEDAVAPADISWLTGRVERFSADQLTSVLSSVIGGAPNHELVEPLFQLYDRGRRTAVAKTIERQMTSWLAQLAVGEAERYGARIAALAPHSDSVRQGAASYAPQWLEAIASCSSAACYAALLQSGEALDFVFVDPRRAGAAAERWITDNAVQGHILRLARKPGGAELVNAVIEMLRAIPRASLPLESIANFLRDDEVRKATRLVAVEHEDVDFYTRVQTVLEREPFAAFNTAIMAARNLDGSVKPPRIDEISLIVWRGMTPPARDVLRICEQYPSLLPATQLLRRLPALLFDAKTPPEDAEQLAEVLSRTENRKPLDRAFYPVAVFKVRRALLRNNPDEPFKALDAGIRLLAERDVDANATAWLADAVSAHLLSLADARAHAKYLPQAIKAHHDLLDNYSRRALERLRTSSAPAATAAKLFQIWAQSGESGEWLLNTVLTGELRTWRRKRLDEVGYEVARAGKAAEEAWALWRPALAEKPSLLGRLFGRGRRDPRGGAR